MQHSWHDRYDPGVPFKLDYPDWTVPDLLRRSATRAPESTALLFYGNRLTYQNWMISPRVLRSRCGPLALIQGIVSLSCCPIFRRH